MRITIILLLLSMSLNAQIIERDKQLHMIAGFGTATMTSAITFNNTKNNRKAFWFGVGSSLIIGTLKEVKDINSTGFSKKDIYFTVAGGVLGATFVNLVIDNKTKRKRPIF